MTRKDVRAGIAKYFGGSTLTAANWYQPTPLAASGLAGVRPYYSTRIADQEYFQTLADGRGMGALMCVHLPEYTEKRLTTGGFMDVPLEIALYVFHLARVPAPETAQQDLDDLVQAVVDRMRADPTLGMPPGGAGPGVVVQAGEGPRGITVSTSTPVNEPGTPPATRQEAVISFTANTYPFYLTPS